MTVNDNGNHSEVENTVEAREQTPLPRLQLAITYLIAGAEPVANSVIYPFVNQFVRETGITGGDERKTGYYAGIIESVFYIAECATVLLWGRASDHWGRRPILLAGTIGLAMAMLGFGLSTHFWMLVVSRCAQGAFNGNIGVVKNVMAEITDSSNRAAAFSFYGPVWAAGSTLGPLIGGGLARPAQRWPETFGKIQLFVSHPYFLPCAIAGVYSIFSFVISAICLRETLPSIVAWQSSKNMEQAERAPNLETALLEGEHHPGYGATSDDDLSTCSSTSSTRSKPESFTSPPVLSVLTGPVCLALTNLGILAFTDQAYQALIPLMYSTSIPLGGLNFTPARIGTILGTWGVLNGVTNIMCFAYAIRRWGPRTVFRVSFGSYFISIGAFPLMSILAKRSGEFDIWVAAAMLLQLTSYMMSFFAYGAIQIFVIDSMPSPEAMATVNGIAQVATSSMRSLGPSFSSSLFSVSLEHHLLGGYMVYVVLASVILIGLQISSKLPHHLVGKM
ncbi:hypothetical protein HGRIS_000897 [Hohenbuehelia grisea]|uniref:Major facilitator superfamily (MFS) profile domain-containing protein n=1 Tax=Hohenbuehelia grisea TaxID=104357 RepID=A0ABR3IQ47_9AGAR